MFSVNLREELQARRKARVWEAGSLETEDLHWLEGLGIDTCLRREQRLAKHRLLMQHAYREDQVQQLCVKYRLRCLPADLFKGEIDEMVPQKKQEFALDYQEAFQQEVSEENYRIVAPGEMFKLLHVQLDPLLMYRFRVGETYYYSLIHQWGGDMSRWRALVNYPLRSARHLTTCSLLCWSVILLALTLGMAGVPSVGAISLACLLILALTLFTVSLFKDMDGNFQTSDNIWNSRMK